MRLPPDRQFGVAVRRAVAVVAAVVLPLAGYAIGAWRAAPDHPGETSVDVGFVRDMSVHHAQAVTLAQVAGERATLPAVREMAADIVLTQQREIGVMVGWLQQWSLPVSTAAPHMAWMTHGHTGTGPDADPPMPGMATRRQVAQLAVARGAAVDRLFCQLMLDHHLGGLHMISEVVSRGDRAEVIALARQMRADQEREINQLREFLHQVDGASSGATPTGARAGRVRRS